MKTKIFFTVIKQTFSAIGPFFSAAELETPSLQLNLKKQTHLTCCESFVILEEDPNEKISGCTEAIF